MLGCSFGEVERRLARRGTHTAYWADEDAGEIARAFREAIYEECEEERRFFDLPRNEFASLFHSQNLCWAPDGDEAFDDGSYVLQFDIGRTVRLIGFKSCEDGTIQALTDLRMDADAFYGILKEWWDRFHAEWSKAPKTGTRGKE